MCLSRDIRSHLCEPAQGVGDVGKSLSLTCRPILDIQGEYLIFAPRMGKDGVARDIRAIAFDELKSWSLGSGKSSTYVPSAARAQLLVGGCGRHVVLASRCQ